MTNKKRQIMPSMAELIDRTTVDTIKMIKELNRELVSSEIQMLLHDLDILIEERNIKLSARLLCAMVVLSQINFHIWETKDRLEEATSEQYADRLRYAHQLNGFRNRIKNFLLELLQDMERGAQWSNDKTDGLEDWIGGLLGYENKETR